MLLPPGVGVSIALSTESLTGRQMRCSTRGLRPRSSLSHGFVLALISASSVVAQMQIPAHHLSRTSITLLCTVNRKRRASGEPWWTTSFDLSPSRMTRETSCSQPQFVVGVVSMIKVSEDTYQYLQVVDRPLRCFRAT